MHVDSLTKVLLEGRNAASPKHMRIVNVASDELLLLPLNCFPNELFEKDIFTECYAGYPRQAG